jgi:hypothetical protein
MSKESWTGKFLDPAKVASEELKICRPCWDARNRPIDLHDCEAMDNFGVSHSAYLRLCDCPCMATTSEAVAPAIDKAIRRGKRN